MSVKTKQKLLELLKWKGPTSQENLASALQLSTMAVSKHLGEFQKQGLVIFEEEKQDRGRPIKIWKLTEASKNHFPDNHPQLAYSIWQSATEVLEQDAIEKILSKHSENKIQEYLDLIPEEASLAQKVEILSDVRSKEGYMTSHETIDEQTFSLSEHHCPICDIASKCQEFCGSEKDIFQRVLGSDVSIEREEHIVSGDHRCTYKITKRN